MKNAVLWSLVFGLWSACVPEGAALDGTHDDLRVEALSVTDTQGVSWPAQGMPRVPRLHVTWNAQPTGAENRVWLVAGPLNGGLHDDLLDPPLRESTRASLRAIAIANDGSTTTVAPATPLRPGEQYTLAVREGPDRLWSRPLTASSGPAAGAELVASLPAEQARGVPTNLARVLLRFDGYVNASAVRPALEVDGRAHDASPTWQRCSSLGLPEGDCLTIVPALPLPPEAGATVRLSELKDSTGARLADAEVRFHTGGGIDVRPPSPGVSACALDERPLDPVGCVLEQDRWVAVRLAASEPVFARLITARAVVAASSPGQDLTLALTALDPGAMVPGTLLLTDLAGNTASWTLDLATRSDLANLSIDEVRSDPLGTEPGQEMVELLNFGTQAIPIMGFSLSDDPFEVGVVIVADLTVWPGERVLAVGPHFDTMDITDGRLPPGVRFARTSGALSLSNDGGELYLRDARGRRVSASPHLTPAQPGACVARVGKEHRSGAASNFAHDPRATCTPGTATVWP